MVAIRVPKSMRSKRELLKHAPRIDENGNKMLILHGTKTSTVLKSVLADLFHLNRDHAMNYTKKNDSIRPIESGGETSLKFFFINLTAAFWCMDFIQRRGQTILSWEARIISAEWRPRAGRWSPRPY